MKFRKKPVVIEAVQFTEAVRDAALFDGQPLPDGVHRGAATLHPPTRKVWSASFFIETLEGRMEVSVGDWVITGIKGERYPCKPDIFAATYEPADDHGTTGIVAPAPNRELSFGEKAVGLGFNPGANPEVHACKAGFAVEIDRMNDLRIAAAAVGVTEICRMASVAITEAQTAQMWAVKAITWKS